MSQNVQLDYGLRLTMEITGADNVSVSIPEEKMSKKMKLDYVQRFRLGKKKAVVCYL